VKGMNAGSKVAVVTGGGKGIGQAIALGLARAGHAVSIWDLDESAARATAEAITAIGVRGHTRSFDLTNDRATAAAAAATLDKLGRIDALVNNAGIMRLTPIEELSMADWDLVIGTNLRAPAICMRECVPAMIAAGGGSIINVASNVVVAARLGNAAYTSAKAGLVGLTRVAALELAKHSIRVNSISPGSTMTDLMKLYDDKMLQDILKGSTEMHRIGIPLGRFAALEDHANAVAFLVSDGARHITGQNLVIDGGQTLA